jgi:NAD(P)H-dependent flavin oxidoreductase YrpB (nitropropane dioxygenase family)
VLLDANVPAYSFIYGIPPKEILDEAKKKRIVTLGTAATPEEAVALDQAGVDVVVASGFEAGGHRGLFLRPAEDSLIGTFSLVPQAVDAVKVPVVAAGGIADARGVAAALRLGGRRADGHCFSSLRGVWRASVAPRSDSQQRSRADSVNSSLYRQTRAKHSQRTGPEAEQA